jgi:exonuclease SbcD
MRIIHTADWHLGRLFHGVHLTEDQAPLLDQIFDLLKSYKAHCLIIAGDIFDRSAPPVEAIRLLNDFLTRVNLDLDIAVIAIAGNHDSPDRLGFASEILGRSGAHLIGNVERMINPAIVHDQYGPCPIYPIPYADPALVRERLESPEIRDHHGALSRIIHSSLRDLKKYPRSIAVAHAFVTGGQKSESERPLAVGAVEEADARLFKDFSYTALGHLHRPQRVGHDHIRYSGALYKYSFEESSQDKSVLALEMDGNGNIETESVKLTPKRDVRIIRGYFRDLLNSGHEHGPAEDYVMVSLKDSGPVVDAMQRLRQVFPNLLRLERDIYGDSQKTRENWGRMRGEMDEKAWFKAFYKHVTGNEMNNKDLDLFNTALELMRKQEREEAE